MDHAILEFEELFNAVRNVREKEEQYGRADSYTYSVKKNDKAFIEGKEHSVGLGDLALRAKAKVWDGGHRVPLDMCLSYLPLICGLM